MTKFRINPKKEINWVLISRSIYCFTLAFIALSIIAMVTGGQIFTFRHVIIFSIFAGIPLSIIYAFTVEIMNIYSVSKLAKMAGVSVRTLHHYDEIGLLKPSFRSDAGYRQYQREDLLRLQQILFYRELDFSLNEIKDILDDPDHDEVQALMNHRQRLKQRIKRLTNLLNTLDKTLLHYKEDNMVLTDEELYEGFSKEQIERYKKEVDEKYDPELVKISKERIGKMSKGQWKEIKAKGENIAREMAEIMDLSPESDDVQKLVKRQHTWIENFYPANAETFKGWEKDTQKILNSENFTININLALLIFYV